MFVRDILWSARHDYLDDARDIKTAAEWYGGAGALQKPLWLDEELLRHLNTSLNEWCRETGCLRDWNTESVCKHLILANKHTYAMSPLITEIHKGYQSLGYPQVYPVDDTWLDENIPTWKRDASTGSVNWLLPDYGKNFFRVIYYPSSSLGYWTGAITFASATKTITHPIGTTETDFSSLLVAADQVVISGSLLNGTISIPKTFTVATVAAGSFTVIETVADEVLATGGIIQKVIDTMWLTVNRLPLAQLTLAGNATEIPEIKEDHHPYLVEGILREAYKKQDSQCLDVQKSEEHKKNFEYRKNKALIEKENLRRSEKTMKPHPGAL